MDTTENVPERQHFPRPTPWELFTLLFLLVLFLLPIVPFWAGSPHALLLGIILAICFWPSLIQIVRLTWRSKSWPAIVGGPNFRWNGRQP